MPDRRCQPHSPEHRAAIARGMAENAFAREQRDLKLAGKPHAYVPPKGKTTGPCWVCTKEH